MSERGGFQGIIDRVVEHGRENKSTATTEALVAGGAIAGVGASRPDLAAAALISAAIISVGSGMYKHATFLAEQMGKGCETQSNQTPTQETPLEEGIPTQLS